MCTGVEIAMLAGTAISAGATVQAGREAKAMGNYQAEQLRADAEAERGAAQVYAEKIRKAGNAERSKMTAALAASGADAASQSAAELDAATVSAYEEDALVALYGGEQKARRNLAAAQGAEISGRRAQRSAIAEAAATGMSGWYRYERDKQPTGGGRSGPAAPVTNRNTWAGQAKWRPADTPAYDASVGGY